MTLRLTDGSTTVAAIVRGYSEHERTEGEKLLSLLVGVGVLDIQGRPVARYLHTATKKGVEPGGDLDPRDMLKLVTDGGYRSYPAMGRLPVLAEIPEELASFFALTRRRRSRRDYSGGAILRSALDAVLTTGCGITGTLEWAGRKVDLRAYPSSGGLYSVEVYPVVLSVRGLACGLYHYSAGASLLEVLDTTIGVEELMAASLPSERDMVRGGAVLFCLTANFSRHERKYGPGGYRMLVAEAGHLSQNLVLAATALGLDARPFGGVYDDLLNRVLGLRSDNEQFLLGVLIGHAG
jgi:SagB-type dehydrogenase family enzyme